MPKIDNITKIFNNAIENISYRRSKHEVYSLARSQSNPHLDERRHTQPEFKLTKEAPFINGLTESSVNEFQNKLLIGRLPSSSPKNVYAIRSVSVTSMNSEASSMQDISAIDQEGIAKLTRDVRIFKETLGKLKRIFSADKEKLEKSRVIAHENLGEVLRILQGILLKYPKLKSTELLLAAELVIRKVKGYRFEDEKSNPADFLESVDQLALAFSSCVSDLLMGDLDTSNQGNTKSRSCENLLAAEVDGSDSCHVPISSVLSPREIDSVMMKSPEGVEIALHHAKMWSKYAKDLASYIEKHSSLEVEHARSLVKLVHTMRPILKEEAFMPFQSIYCTALDQDVEYANSVLATCNLLQSHKYIEPLMARRNEHERIRKQLKDTWHRELKKMQEAVSNLRKSKTLYVQRQQDYDKAKESLQKIECNTQGNDMTDSSKLDKKRKLKDDNLQKALEAETTYKACVMEANERQLQLEKVKGEVLKQVRELVYQCDQTMKAVTVSYFQLQHTVNAPAPVQYQTLCESSRLYEPGLQYMERVKRQPFSSLQHSMSMSAVLPKGSGGPTYVFEPYNSERFNEKTRQSTDSGAECDDGNVEIAKNRLSTSSKSWIGSTSANASDSDSIESTSNRSRDPSPSTSPRMSSHDGKIPFGIAISSGDELETELEPASTNITRRQTMSKAAITHTFRKLKTPSRCRECDSYVYFQGVECTECGLSCHKKCLEALAIQCGHKRLPRKMTTFGVELATHLLNTNTGVPPIVTKCVSEVDARGIEMKGIYRVSGVKSKVEKLCQTFESGMELVDASEIRPCVIANVLKLYLRQLPEPLLTFRYYKEFINITKLLPDNQLIVEELKRLVQLLPIPYYKTLAFLIHHLRRVSNLCEINNMPSSNLGIVFGPTLLRTREGSASLSSLVDTVHQAKVVEFLIDNAQVVFGPENKIASVPRTKKSDGNEKTVSGINENQDNVDFIGSKADTDELNSSSDDWKDITAEFESELVDSCLQEDCFDSPTLHHPAFSRRSAARMEHRRYRHISEGYNLSELSKESSILHQAVVQRRKTTQQNLTEATKETTYETTDESTFQENVTKKADGNDMNEHKRLRKVSETQVTSISAQNAHLRSKFFGETSSEDSSDHPLTKTLSTNLVTNSYSNDDGNSPFTSRVSNRLSKGAIYLPKTCLIPNEEIILPDRPVHNQKVESAQKKFDQEEKFFTSKYSLSSKEQSKRFVHNLRSKSPDRQMGEPLMQSVSVTLSSNGESESYNEHRTVRRISGSLQPQDSSSESLSSDQSSRYYLKSRYHSPLIKTKSSGSSDGYNEDDELMVQNSESNSSPNPESSENSPLTFV